MWEIRFNLEENLERTLCRPDITILNLLALVDTHGYGISDKIYCVKEKGIGLQGVELIDIMDKVESVLTCLERNKIMNLTVIRART